MSTQVVDPALTNEGEGLSGAPVAPADNGRTKPEGMDEQHGTPAAKDGQQSGSEKKTDEGTGEQQKAADEAEKAKETPKDIEGPLREYVSLDHPSGQAAIDMLKNAGVGPNEANAFFAEAIQNNDIQLVDWAGLEARVGKSAAHLIKVGVESYYTEMQQRTTATVEATYDIFGGKDNFEVVKQWAKTLESTDKAFASDLSAIRDMLNEGGAKAKAGARELLRLYNADTKTKGLDNKKLVVGDSTGTVVGTPLSRAQYLEEIKKAHDSKAPQHVIAAIQQRRKAGMAAGL